jgi:tRNA-2-methylthio-N6-dimethylallyladenosine synthase
VQYTILTYGCQMNEADSRLIAAVLDRAGWQESPGDARADLVVINTCSVREKPEQKVRSLLGTLRQRKRDRPALLIAVVGCMAQREGLRLARRSPHVDVVLGTRCSHRIVEALDRALAGERPVVITDLAADAAAVRCEVEESADQPAPLRAFVPVILGCTNFCAYCIVPFVRGRETSRPPEEIRREVESLVSRGTREVTLLGQNVLAYGRDLRARTTFSDLLAQLNDVPGLWRLRFTTCHPRDADWDLIDAIANLSHVCEHIHLPLQAGTDKLLSDMNRGYTVEDYQRVMERLRASVPGIAITTDIMVGFPGETDEDYEESLRLYARLRFDAAFTFAYSVRPGTRAADRPDQVPHEVKIARLNRLIQMQNRITRDINAAEVGRVVEVLVDGPAEKGEGLLAGKARSNKQVIFPGPLRFAGSLTPVRLTSSDLWGFRGLAPRLP